jgi:Asp-tRNA(Asn)/Glu-tRNA(Gln) amidotransferase A subunit family amidase
LACLLRDEASAPPQRSAGPLAGKLVAVRDIFDTVDLPTSYSSPITQRIGRRPSGDGGICGVPAPS